jgi:hypothetical protein
MTTSGDEREVNGRQSRRRDMRRRPSRIERWQCGREDGRQSHCVKMQHSNQPVQTRGGVEDGHVRRHRDKRWREAEAVRQEATRQPVGKQETNRRRGASGLEASGRQEAEGASQEAEAARQEEEVLQETTRQPVGAIERQTGGEASANKRQRCLESRRVCREEKKRQWRHNERRRGNQPGYKRQTGGVAPADKRRQYLESRRRLKFETLQEDKRRRQCVVKMRGRGGGGSTDATRQPARANQR